MNTPTWNETCAHLASALQPKLLREAVAKAKADLENVTFDSIAVTGLSGTIFGTALSYETGVPLVVVRKQETPAPHSWSNVEGPDSVERFIFVDDLIDSGSTFRRVLGATLGKYPNAVCAGVYCYHKAPSESTWNDLAELVLGARLNRE